MPYKTFKELIEEGFIEEVWGNDAYDWSTGAPDSEHLPEDQHVIELEKAHDEIKALKERLSFYEESEEGEIIGLRNLTDRFKEQITGYEEKIKSYEEEISNYCETIEKLNEMLVRHEKVIRMRGKEIERLEQRLVAVKANAYDLMEEKASLLRELLESHLEKEDTE